MPRIRSLKPEFWDSPSTAKASFEARLLFMAMWNWADDAGRGDANARRLMGFAFPHDDLDETDFPRLKEEITNAYDVTWYTVSGRSYYEIPSWDEHQRTERRAQGKYPGPDGNVVRAQEVPDVDKEVPALEQGNRGTGEQRNRGERARAPRGTRIPDDFAVSEKLRAWAQEKVPTLDIDVVTERFVDYWQAQAGARSLKADWDATWRTWMQRENANNNAPRVQPPPASPGRQPAPGSLRPSARLDDWRLR